MRLVISDTTLTFDVSRKPCCRLPNPIEAGAPWTGEPDAVHPLWLNDHSLRCDRSSCTWQVREKQSAKVHRQPGDDEKREYSSVVMRDKERVENARHDDDQQQSEDAAQDYCDRAARVEFKGQRNGHDSCLFSSAAYSVRYGD